MRNKYYFASAHASHVYGQQPAHVGFLHPGIWPPMILSVVWVDFCRSAILVLCLRRLELSTQQCTNFFLNMLVMKVTLIAMLYHPILARYQCKVFGKVWLCYSIGSNGKWPIFLSSCKINNSKMHEFFKKKYEWLYYIVVDWIHFILDGVPRWFK